jgi:pyochelin biosynthetic protein PchC
MTWIRRFHESPEASARLVCFPHAGGAATYFYPLSRTLAPSIEALAVQYPGRQDRRAEPCVDDIHELADLVAPALLEWADRPLALFGHSMGATLAFEVAGRLEKSGVRPAGLFVSGRRAPSSFRDERLYLADDEKIVASLKSMNAIDSRVLDDPDILAMILPAVRADYKAAETYRFRSTPALSCPVVAMTGDDDPQVSTAEARDWALHTLGDFELKVFSGGHFFLDSHTEAVLESITTSLWEVTDGALEPARP